MSPETTRGAVRFAIRALALARRHGITIPDARCLSVRVTSCASQGEKLPLWRSPHSPRCLLCSPLHVGEGEGEGVASACPTLFAHAIVRAQRDDDV